MFLFILFLLSLTFFGCVNEEVLIHPPGGRSFWALKIKNGSVETKRVVALYAGESRYAISYVDVQSRLSEGVIKQVMREFDERIAPRLNRVFTEPLDIDGNGKIVFLFLDIDDNYDVGGGYIAGYFDALNQFSDDTVKKVTGRRSNEMELIYLDTHPSDVGSLEFLATLAHEYQHLLQFSYNFRNNSDEAIWVDEGLSEIASDIAGYGPQIMRLLGFRYIGNSNCNSQGCLVGDSLITWDGNLDDYNHVYVYFRYLADVWGESILQKIFQNPSEDVAGLEEAFLQQGLPNHCGGFAGGYLPSYPRFLCSYRYFWGAILGLNFLQGKTGNLDLTPTPLPGFFASGHNPRLPLLPGDFNSIAQNPVPSLVQTFYPYTFSYYQHNGINQPPQLTESSCSSCELHKFTLIYNANNFVVFNHHIGEGTAKTRLVDLQLVEGFSKIPRGSSSKGYKMHFYQNIPHELRDKLLQIE